jgi:DNA-binding NarL/FixJ family response regulator
MDQHEESRTDTVVIVVAPRDNPLTNLVREAVDYIGGCMLQRVEDLELAFRWKNVGLILVYVAEGTEVVKWMEEHNPKCSRAPVLVVTEYDDPQRDLQLLRLGVTECLSAGPLSVSRLALLIELITLRHRLKAATEPAPSVLAPDVELSEL